MKFLIAPLTALVLTAPALADYGTGTITGTLALNDARWVVASEGDGPTSAFSEQDGTTQIRLVGTPEPESSGGTGTLTIEIDAASGMFETRTTDVRIELEGPDSTLVAESENIDLTMEAFEQAGESLVIAGSFVATLTEDPQDGLIVEPNTSVTLDGNFQATIPSGSDG